MGTNQINIHLINLVKMLNYVRYRSAVDGADVVTTDVWASMGDEHENEERKKYLRASRLI